MTIQVLKLKKNEDRRLRVGHLWIYSNEIDSQQTPLKAFAAGEPVIIQDHNGRNLGMGYVNPHSLICARLISTRAQDRLDITLLIKRLTIALKSRSQLFTRPYYRLVYGESDGLPGLVIDRFQDIVVAQITTAGMEMVKALITEALCEVLKPQTIIYKNDNSIRQMEDLENYTETAFGPTPEFISVEENNTLFQFSAFEGQKTGWYYDHRISRKRTQYYAKDKRVLDVFSYVGGWGIQAAVAGAREVLCVDTSKTALQYLRNNAELNNIADKINCIENDAFDALKLLIDQGEKFDVVIIDPPAFIKRKKDHQQGLNAYQRINMLALQLLNDDGLLISASCSYHLSRTELLNAIVRANKSVHKWIQVIEQGHQGPDHPIHPAITETEYIKTVFCRTLTME